tara:strand:+ start:304 stop:837 length:534 start_codon:yes stop_codon:yes gene_type:complete
MYDIVPITTNLYSKLQIFCDKCNNLGYTNNSSFKAMKLEWCKDWGEYYCAIKNNEIIAVGGCHPLPQISKNGWRILFRGCELPKISPYKGLNKGNWNTITWRDFIPVFIKNCPTDELYITTNISNEHSGKALRNHKLITLLAKQDLLNKVCDTILYDTEQTIWKLNVPVYVNRRSVC